jgi:hypothetical protein
MAAYLLEHRIAPTQVTPQVFVEKSWEMKKALKPHRFRAKNKKS